MLLRSFRGFFPVAILLTLLRPLPVAALGAGAQAGKAGPAATAAAPAAPAALRILSDTTLGEPLKYAVDVRWASGRSVYLALKRRGVVEYDLDGKAEPKQLIPGEKEPGGFWLSYHVAASSQFLIAGSPLFALTWRPLDSAVRKDEAFEGIDDLDVQGGRLAVVGVRRDSAGKFAPEGAIAWTGSLDKDLSDLKPLVFDAGGPGAPNANACGLLLLGSTRFLADGSLLVVPGVQPGIYHFDSRGKLLQTLDTVKLGIDTDCASVTKDQGLELKRSFSPRMAWINARRTVDDVLPLPAGPGLLVRSVKQGQVNWALKILHPDGSIAIYDLPVHAHTLLAHLKGDVRQGRLVLLLWEYSPDGKPDGAPMPHLLTASLPDS
ncbi:MAG TPA: hypothetical protein VFE25_08135 [Opitutaceae bacterium]|jgi:hypothetical protein|nr:hypothetical protein [Opitutaceae bacterium]